MAYKPASTYDAKQRIWSGKDDREYFAPDLSIGEIIFNEMRRHPQLVAQISDTENTILTREELHLNSMRVASYMRTLGLLQSDIVGIIARNTTHISAVAYGCFFNGIAFHALNICYSAATIQKLFNITKPCLIFCDGEDYAKVKAATANLDVKIITMRNHQNDSISIEQILTSAVKADFKPARLEQGNYQTLAILCSSGTTGTPKAVTISNSRNILNVCPYLTTDDVQYTHSSLDWISGLWETVTSGVFSTKRIIADNQFNPACFLRLIEKHKVTWLMQGTSHMAMTTNCPEFEQANLNSVRSYNYGGGRSNIEVQRRIRSRLQSDCLHYAYGFTELGSIVSKNWHFDEKPNSVGRVLNGYKLKIVSEQDELLSPNELGELCVYSSQYWAGYYGNPKVSQNMRDSQLWFHTGDLGYIDEDGFLYILERKKEMCRYQGLMYYPYEIEDVISKMPGVQEVCVFGIWNQFNGDEAAASVVRQFGSKIDAQDVVHYVQQNIADKHMHLHGGAIVVEDLKRCANGKMNRKATKDYFLGVKDRK